MFISMEVERLRRYVSRADMAKAVAVNVDTSNDWINKRCAIPAEVLRALSRLFDGCTLDYRKEPADAAYVITTNLKAPAIRLLG